jgi:hypothetical protein
VNGRSRDIAVDIATGYDLDGRRVRVRVPVRAIFCPYHLVQTGSEAHPATYPMSTGRLFPGVKPPGREADHSLPKGAEVKNT